MIVIAVRILGFTCVVVIAMRIFGFTCVVVIAMRILGFACMIVIAVRILGFTCVVVVAVRVFGLIGMIVILRRCCSCCSHRQGRFRLARRGRYRDEGKYAHRHRSHGHRCQFHNRTPGIE